MSAKDPLPEAKTPGAAPAPGYRTLTPGAPKPAAAAQPSPAKPAPKPEAAKPEPGKADPAKPDATPDEEKPHADPTRYGDWEVKGRCIDF
ncbi:MAG: DUF1674 domain-containing protein [Gemmatimonas sp.]